jgi:hypothetical protein
MDYMRSLASLMAVLVLASFGEPRLVPHVRQGPLGTSELIRRADAILIGTITTLEFGDRIHTEVAGMPGLTDCLLPVRVTVSVEHVLRGDTGPGPLDYQYFGAACGTMGPVESPHPDTRSIFFLRKQLGRWTVNTG